MRSTASPPWCCVALFLVLLFLRLVRVSIINLVRELVVASKCDRQRRQRQITSSCHPDLRYSIVLVSRYPLVLKDRLVEVAARNLST